MTEDIIARIDAATGCQRCGGTLKPNGPSRDFCDELCQKAWHARWCGRSPIAGRLDQLLTLCGHDDMPEWQRSYLNALVEARSPDVDRAELLGPPTRQGRGFSADYVIIDEMEIVDLPPAQLRTEPIKLTQEQFDLIPTRPPGYFHSGSLGAYAGMPVELVDTLEESTPYLEGWIPGPPAQGWLSRWFGRHR